MLIDNWMLQSAAELIEGSAGWDAVGDVLRRRRGVLGLEEIPQNILRLEALMDLVDAIVLTDVMVVDAAFQGVWTSRLPIRLGECIISKEMGEKPGYREQLRVLRGPYLAAMEEEPLIRDGVARAWEAYETTGDGGYFMATIVGCAGYLARSEVEQLAYLPSPFRRRALVETGLGGRFAAAPHVTILETIKGARSKIQSSFQGRGVNIDLHVGIGPIAMQVLGASESIEGVLPAALQLRADPKFVHLRQWLRKLEDAVASGDPKAIGSFLSELDRAVVDAEHQAGLKLVEPPKATIGAGLSLKGPNLSFGLSDGRLGAWLQRQLGTGTAARTFVSDAILQPTMTSDAQDRIAKLLRVGSLEFRSALTYLR